MDFNIKEKYIYKPFVVKLYASSSKPRVDSHFVVSEDTETTRAKTIWGLYLTLQLLFFGYINIAF